MLDRRVLVSEFDSGCYGAASVTGHREILGANGITNKMDKNMQQRNRNSSCMGAYRGLGLRVKDLIRDWHSGIGV